MPVGFKRRAVRALRRMAGFLAYLFTLQQQLVKHPARRKALLTPRRAGKTEAACVWLLNEANKNPGKKYLYVALTKPNARDITWLMFKRLNRIFRLGARFLKDDLEIILPNGAMILLRGADQENWIGRLEGQEFELIIVDEAGLYTINLRHLIYDSLSPMVDSCGGTICLIGRPGLVKTDLFWDLTRPENREGPKGDDGAWMVLDRIGGKEWAIFNWSTLENPFVADRWRKEIEEKLRINPAIINDPGFRRNYLGEWAEDVQGLVYSFDRARNVVNHYKIQPGDQFGMATDFGWDDAQGFLVGVWNPDRPKFTVLESYKQRQMPLSEALKQMEMYQARYPGLRMWGDPARKQLYMEMAIRFGEGHVVNPAEKAEKHDYIDLMNNDFALEMIEVVSGTIEFPDGSVIQSTNNQYIDELQSLRRLVKTTIVDAALNEERPGEWIEHPKQANDLCDCGLYAWRGSRHFRFQAQVAGPTPGTPEFYDQMAKDYWAEQAQKRNRNERKAWWDK